MLINTHVTFSPSVLNLLCQLRFKIFWICWMSTKVVSFILQLFVTMLISNFESLSTHKPTLDPSTYPTSLHEEHHLCQSCEQNYDPSVVTIPKHATTTRMISIFLHAWTMVVWLSSIWKKKILSCHFHKWQQVVMKVVFHLELGTPFQCLLRLVKIHLLQSKEKKW